MADPMTTAVDEPAEDGALVLVGWEGDQWLYMRDDDLDAACVHRWYVVAGERTDGEAWDDVVRDKRTGELLPVVRLRTFDEIAAAAEAKAVRTPVVGAPSTVEAAR